MCGYFYNIHICICSQKILILSIFAFVVEYDYYKFGGKYVTKIEHIIHYTIYITHHTSQMIPLHKTEG